MPYSLPSYAVPLLNPLGLGSLSNVSAMDTYSGLVSGSFFQISPTTLIYEAKLAIDGDGSGGKQPGDTSYKSHTSLYDSTGAALNSLTYPFMVLPQAPLLPKTPAPRLEDFGVRLGDVGVAFWKKAFVAFIYGDVGPHGSIGEGSSFVAKKLGLNPSAAVGGIAVGEIPPGVIHLIFPGSTDVERGRTSRSPADITTEAMARLVPLGINLAPAAPAAI